MTKAARRLIVIEINATQLAIERDLPATLVVMIDGVQTEMNYKHYSSAFAAATRIVRALGLIKMPKVAAWRSKAVFLL